MIGAYMLLFGQLVLNFSDGDTFVGPCQKSLRRGVRLFLQSHLHFPAPHSSLYAPVNLEGWLITQRAF
jgi:hypothetical protein